MRSSLEAQSDTVVTRIVLIGDAGQLTGGKHPVVDAVRDHIPLDKKTTVLFLGDNVYRNGLPSAQASTYARYRAVLDTQISIADNTPAKVFMIPGNHDWQNGQRGGYDAILRQQLYVDFLTKTNVEYYPKDGCPGPVEVNLGNGVILVMYDSQWWLHPHEKPEIESDCKCKTKDEVVNQISDIIARHPKELVILACHHPFKSNGPHGGFFTLKQHIFPFTDMKKNLYIPLPVLGSIYPIVRSVFGTPQDLSHPNYADMIGKISAVVRESSPNVVFVSGHDHNLQLLHDNGYYYVISGGGCKQNRTSKNKNTLYNERTEGFAVMEITANKNVNVTYYTVGDTLGAPRLFTLLNYSKSAADSAIAAVPPSDPVAMSKKDTSIAISREFGPIRGLRRYFMGQNYRQEWSTPVRMKVLHLEQEKGGFKVDHLGGGKQTKTLHLFDKKGKEWVLRTMDKSPSQTIPEAFQGTVVDDILKELKSASFPYGALAVPGLAKAINLDAPKPELFFVPDDSALGIYRRFFANSVCMLEKQDPTQKDTKTTSKILFQNMLEENDHLPVQPDVLRARLLDMVIADYDRHMDQWRWSTEDTGKGKLYHPIPRDRDQAFFYSDGKLMKMISSHRMPFLKGFRDDIPKVEWLGYTARDFDRIFLSGLNAADWKNSIAEVQRGLSDSVIRSSVQQLPPEIFRITGENLVRKMISRRNALAPAAMQYYRFLSKKVNVVGSNQKEYFRVTSEGKGLRVKVYAWEKSKDTGFVMYDRVFDPAVTKEIRLFGLNDNDYFEIDKNASSRIKVRMIGGLDIDTFDIKGNVEALLYDLENGGNGIKNNHKAKNRFSKDPPANDRNILGFNYDYSKFPQVHLNYNSDDGLLVGAGFSHRTFGFLNVPYATDQKLSALYSVTRKAIQLKYNAEFNHITRGVDLLVNAKYSSPSLQNFFGLGGESRVDPSKPRDYYQTRYRSFEMEALLRRRSGEVLKGMIGPYFYSYSNQFNRNKNNVLSKPALVGLDSADVFSNKSYLGAKLAVLIDNRNKEFLPTRGIRWYSELVGLRGLNDGSHNYSAFNTDMTIYASMSDPARLIAILKFGGGHIFSKYFEYFQALSIGADNQLYGFRKNRYLGTSTLYGGLELRLNLANIDSYILPGTLGISAFGNAARISLKEKLTQKWHGAYGVGIYYLPFNLFAISAYAGFSENQKMLNFTLGTRFNLTY